MRQFQPTGRRNVSSGSIVNSSNILEYHSLLEEGHSMNCYKGKQITFMCVIQLLHVPLLDVVKQETIGP